MRPFSISLLLIALSSSTVFAQASDQNQNLNPNLVEKPADESSTKVSTTQDVNQTSLPTSEPAQNGTQQPTSNSSTSPPPGQTICYNYFLEKDGCVSSSPRNSERCPEGKFTPGGGLFNKQLNQTGPVNRKRGIYQTFSRRYDTYSFQKAFPIAGGSGICGDYDGNAQEGVCLWSGPSNSGADPATAGWLNGAARGNCGKRLYVQRQGVANPVFLNVVDGCSFDTVDPSMGCYQIAFTNKTFWALNPTIDEVAAQGFFNITWNFDNEKGTDFASGPF
ncbi:hypothetical protein O181_072904 [Austropuccinia psidii MF-1]|uniref:Secreted protein n=1 Tax=Austropuccinia psidii MF-1 TaxID=1389203 RepID=A0A9Q3F5N1_9BASI|nr:hypothetical protein [Austropuccinia psidii MF-1]